MINLIRHHRHLKALCKQQTQELSDKGELIAQLIAENQQLRRSNQVLAENAKIAEDKVKAYEILAEKIRPHGWLNYDFA